MSLHPNADPTTPFARQLEQARGGCPHALGALLDSCRHYLLLAANQVLGDDVRAKAGASDLVQDAFLDAHQHIGSFRGATQPELLAWLGEILRCRLSNHHRDFRHTGKRQISREVTIDLHAGGVAPADGETPSVITSRQEETRLLEAAIARLPGDYRRVVVLRYQEHRSFEEIASLVGRSLDATRQLWKRAIRQLREELGHP